MLFARSLVGIGEASYATIAPTLIADRFPKSVRGRALSTFYIAIPVGAALGYALGGILGKEYGWRAAFLVVGLPGLFLALGMIFVPEPVRGGSEGVAAASLEAEANRPFRWSDVWNILRVPSYAWTTAGMTAMTFVMGGLAHWMPTYLQRVHHLEEDVAGFRFGLVTCVAGLLGTFTGGWFADWLQKRTRAAYALVSGAGMLAGAPFAAIALSGVSDSAWVLWGSLFLCEFFLFVNTGPSNSILLGVVPPRLRATGFALHIFVIHALGDATSPLVIGAASDYFKAFVNEGQALRQALLLAPIVLAVSGVLYALAGRTLSRDVDRVVAALEARA